MRSELRPVLPSITPDRMPQRGPSLVILVSTCSKVSLKTNQAQTEEYPPIEPPMAIICKCLPFSSLASNVLAVPIFAARKSYRNPSRSTTRPSSSSSNGRASCPRPRRPSCGRPSSSSRQPPPSSALGGRSTACVHAQLASSPASYLENAAHQGS